MSPGTILRGIDEHGERMLFSSCPGHFLDVARVMPCSENFFRRRATTEDNRPVATGSRALRFPQLSQAGGQLIPAFGEVRQEFRRNRRSDREAEGSRCSSRCRIMRMPVQSRNAANR